MNIDTLEYSVVIPFGKKNGDFLRCITSIVTQNIAPQKIFVICNGEITASYAELLKFNFSRDTFKLINFIYPDKCTNANIARNIGLNLVETEWVAFVDSDDWWDAGWIDAVSLVIKNKNIDFLYGSIKVYSDNKNFSELHCFHYSKLRTPENYLLAYKPAQTSTYFINTKLARNTGWDEGLRRHQDYDFFVRAVSLACEVATVPGLFVNVDWATVRRHKYHKDCLVVVKNWASHVEKKYYIRHLRNLMKSAIASRDWKAVFPLLSEQLASIFKRRKFL